MSALICGSIAYDTIMLFSDHFKDHIPGDQVHMLNVSFLVPEMRRETGGCAGNIGYNLKLLGGSAKIMATVNHDFTPYGDWLEECGLDLSHIRTIDATYTTQAFITTDNNANQITAFHPGAMDFSHHNRVDDARGITIGIVAPDDREGMIEHAFQFAESGIPFILDPDQGLPLFSAAELLRFVAQANWIAVNDYEANCLDVGSANHHRRASRWSMP